MPKAIGYATYKTYAKRYKIPITKMVKGKRVKKTMTELAKAIYKHEEKIGKPGLYI
jgi:hypothetical protein